MFLGSWKIDDLLTFSVNTHTPSTGAAVDADAVPDYRVYEDETGTAILTGSMAKLDDANTTGFYSEQITLSAANGFEKGKCYRIRVTGVVGGVTGVAERTLQIEAEVDVRHVGGQTASAAATVTFPSTIASTTNITAGTITTVSGNVTGSVGSCVGAVGSVTGAVGSVAGAVGSVTGSIGSVAAGGITAASIADGAIDAATFAADCAPLPVVRSGTAQSGGASTITLDASASATNDIYNDNMIYTTGGTGAGQSAWITDYVGATKVATVKPAWITVPDATTTFSILPAASVWHQVMADHVVALSTGAALNAAGGAGDPWITDLPGAYTGTQAGNIIGLSLPGIAAGSANGLLRSGTNAGTTTFGALTVTGGTTLTGNVALAAGLSITQSTTNANAVDITGNGTGKGISCFGGATGINSHGALFQGGAGGGHGVAVFGIGAGSGLICTAGATGTAGLQAYGGAGSGYGLLGKSGATGGAGAYWWGWGTNAIGEWAVGSGTGAGCYIESAENAHGLHIAGSGSGQGVHIKGGATGPGLEINGGATSGDGILIDTTSGVAVSAASGITANITGNITGNLSGSAGSVVGAIGSITAVTFPANFGVLGINASGHITRATTVDTVTTLTGHTAQTGDSFARIGATGSGLTSLASQASVTAITGSVLTEAYAAAGAPLTLPNAIYGIHQTIHHAIITGLSRSTKKRDGTEAFTTAFNANPPTQISQP